MRLHKLGWAVLASMALMTPPALATSTTEVPSAQQTAMTVPGDSAKSDVLKPASVTPGESKNSPTVPLAPGVPGTGPASGPTESAPPDAPAAEAVPEPKPEPVITLHVDINLTNQRLTVKSDGEVLYTWPISSGRGGYATPTGTFKPQWRARMWYSRQYDDAPMPHSVFFNRGIATHGTTSTHLLGRPASHGCVRLSPKNAATLYNLVGKHGMASTQIVVRGTTPSTPVARNRHNQQWYREADRRRRAPRGYASGGYYSYGAPWWAW